MCGQEMMSGVDLKRGHSSAKLQKASLAARSVDAASTARARIAASPAAAARIRLAIAALKSPHPSLRHSHTLQFTYNHATSCIQVYLSVRNKAVLPSQRAS